jgi:hypothetical protein
VFNAQKDACPLKKLGLLQVKMPLALTEKVVVIEPGIVVGLNGA